MAYADYCESDEGDDREDLARPGPGEDWYDYAPETPPSAYALAGELWANLLTANGEAGVYTLNARALAVDGVVPDPEEFGRCLAMEAMGSGVSWFDGHKPFPMVVPHLEVSMFTFDESSYRGEE